MCMHKTDFSLHYDSKAHAYIGYGYKNISELTAKQYRIWVEATGNQYGGERLKDKTSDNSGGKYVPGFHIFLNKADADKYRHGKNNVVRVKFKEVLAFGTNESAYGEYGPCIISRYMKLA